MITVRSTDFLLPVNRERFGCTIKTVPTSRDGSRKILRKVCLHRPRHYRIRGKDYIIAIRDDGNVYLMNRRGELLKNFPLNLNARPSGDYYLETGSSRENTAFVLVSRDGFRIKFNLDGKVLTREALVKNTVDAHFSLVPEKDFKSYMILRQEAKQLTLFDEKLNTIVSSDFIGRPTHTQYNDFGSGKVYITDNR